MAGLLLHCCLSPLPHTTPPRPLPLARFPGVRFGGWPELQKSRCVRGSFKEQSQGSLGGSILRLYRSRDILEERMFWS